MLGGEELLFVFLGTFFISALFQIHREALAILLIVASLSYVIIQLSFSTIISLSSSGITLFLLFKYYRMYKKEKGELHTTNRTRGPPPRY